MQLCLQMCYVRPVLGTRAVSCTLKSLITGGLLTRKVVTKDAREVYGQDSQGLQCRGACVAAGGPRALFPVFEVSDDMHVAFRFYGRSRSEIAARLSFASARVFLRKSSRDT